MESLFTASGAVSLKTSEMCLFGFIWAKKHDCDIYRKTALDAGNQQVIFMEAER